MRDKSDVFPLKHFIENSHIKFLESAGARVVPIDHTMNDEDLEKMLSQLNGLYIPGDSKTLVTDSQWGYTKMVRRILRWAQRHNEVESQHFPILAVGYGALAMIRSQMKDEAELTQFAPGGGYQQNLVHDPKHTYLFDEFTREQLEDVLDKIKFFSDLELGINMEDFVLDHNTLSNIFMPVCTFHNTQKESQNKEFVSAIEGILYPWFGVMYRIDRIQFSQESKLRDLTDHSKDAIHHAQKIANLFIDEARLSSNEFKYVGHESDFLNLIKDNDPLHFEVPLI